MAESDSSIPRVGDEIDVTIQSMAFGGEGVARCDNYVLFVPDVIPGERVRIKVTQAKRSYGRAALVEVLEASSARTEPRCDVYGLCGGCQYQHVAYPTTLEYKQQQLKDAVLRIGGIAIEHECEPVRPAPEPYGYRNVISLRVVKGPGGWEVGYVARDNRTFVAVSRCPIAREAIDQSLGCIGPVLETFEHSDMIREISIKSAGERLLFYPVYESRFRHKSDDRLCYRYQDLTFHYGPTSFFQVNHSMVPALIDVVGQALDGSSEETLFDLYAGVGLFSIAFASRYHRVVGIEVARESAEWFEANANRNKRGNVIVVQGRAERVLELALGDYGNPVNSALVDPPREGLKKEVIEVLNRTAFRRLVYVSCDPATLARDLKLLTAAFSIKKITPLDMFPQTKHLETVAVLVRRSG